MALYDNIIDIIMVVMLFVGGISTSTSEPTFNDNYEVIWGYQHVTVTGSEVEIYMDNSSGAVFESKSSYGSGFFSMKIKLPAKDSGGVVTTYYLSSGDNYTQDELDFEFLGNRENKPITLQTNVIVGGKGNREHRVHLWFDPTADFHLYQILWNRHHIVFFVDNIPIRYFKNNTNLGVVYPSKPLKILASIWDGSNWATDGGKTKVNWTHAPFRAYYQGFNINGCPISKGGNINNCNSTKYWWNDQQYADLTPLQEKAYQIVKHNYVTYDYCYDRRRYPIPPPECSTQ